MRPQGIEWHINGEVLISMGYSPKRTKSEIAAICEHINKKDECWVDSLWHLVDYLINIQFSKRCLAVTEEKAWDATTDIFLQIKQRIDCKEKVNKDGVKTKLKPIEDIVSYVYFVLPKRFSKWCSTTMTREERDKALLRMETFNPNTQSYTTNLRVEQEMAVEMRMEKTTREEAEKMIVDWLGKATNNIELKNRKAKLKAQGWEIVEGHLVQIELTEKEMARELAILESRKEDLPQRERKRIKRINYLRRRLYGKQGKEGV